MLGFTKKKRKKKKKNSTEEAVGNFDTLKGGKWNCRGPGLLPKADARELSLVVLRHVSETTGQAFCPTAAVHLRENNLDI